MPPGFKKLFHLSRAQLHIAAQICSSAIREHHNGKMMPPIVLISGSWYQLEIAGIPQECHIVLDYVLNEWAFKEEHMSISTHPYILGFQFSQHPIIFFYHLLPSYNSKPSLKEPQGPKKFAATHVHHPWQWPAAWRLTKDNSWEVQHFYVLHVVCIFSGKLDKPWQHPSKAMASMLFPTGRDLRCGMLRPHEIDASILINL